MLIDLLRSRRSIRHFQKRAVEAEKIDILVEAALRAPSSRGFDPWELVVVTDPAIISRLSQAKKHGSSFMKDAPLAVVVCADPEVSDVWVEDASIVSLILHLTAADLGLGSCWVQIRLRERGDHQSADRYVGEILGLPEQLRVEAIVAIGYPDESKSGHPLSALRFDKVSVEHYSHRQADSQ